MADSALSSNIEELESHLISGVAVFEAKSGPEMPVRHHPQVIMEMYACAKAIG